MQNLALQARTCMPYHGVGLEGCRARWQETRNGEGMKIALIIERMDTLRGGRETSTAQIAAGLARRGQDVTIICQRASWTHAGVTVRQLGSRGALRVERMRNFAADVAGALAQTKYDIVHAMSPMPCANVYQLRSGTVPGAIEGSSRRWKWLGSVRKALFEPLNFPRGQQGIWERQLVADSGVLMLPVSEMVAGEIQRHYGRTDNVRVVYNAVDVPDVAAAQRAQWRAELRRKLDLGESDTLFLSLATNFELKGVAETIRFFARWYHSAARKGDARLVIIGRSACEGYQRLGTMREIGSKLLILPPADDVFPWYSAADAVVLLSWYDPCSRVVLEATRWGVPSITTAFNGAAEILKDSAGIVVPSPADGKAVAAAMATLCDPDARARCRDACLRVADKLSIDRHVQELLAAYAQAQIIR